jgi:hypothetical protein
MPGDWVHAGILMSRLERTTSTESRITLLESDVFRLRKLIDGEHLYRRGREFFKREGVTTPDYSVVLSLLKESADLWHADSAFCYA